MPGLPRRRYLHAAGGRRRVEPAARPALSSKDARGTRLGATLAKNRHQKVLAGRLGAARAFCDSALHPRLQSHRLESLSKIAIGYGFHCVVQTARYSRSSREIRRLGRAEGNSCRIGGFGALPFSLASPDVPRHQATIEVGFCSFLPGTAFFVRLSGNESSRSFQFDPITSAAARAIIRLGDGHAVRVGCEVVC
jgi:hypothetical protein